MYYYFLLLLLLLLLLFLLCLLPFQLIGRVCVRLGIYLQENVSPHQKRLKVKQQSHSSGQLTWLCSP